MHGVQASLEAEGAMDQGEDTPVGNGGDEDADTAPGSGSSRSSKKKAKTSDLEDLVIKVLCLSQALACGFCSLCTLAQALRAHRLLLRSHVPSSSSFSSSSSSSSSSSLDLSSWCAACARAGKPVHHARFWRADVF